jgi:hypothetical protein
MFSSTAPFAVQLGEGPVLKTPTGDLITVTRGDPAAGSRSLKRVHN